MEMTIPVTLIVKAPNQQIEDQTVKCELSWTISKLKGHLSEVYPSKPARDAQKLIYSGQLLPDSVVLKDILRNYDGQDTHTVHLVCAPSSNNVEIPKPQPKMSETPALNTSDVDISQTSSNAGLHHRAVNPNHADTVPDYRNIWASMAQTYNIADPQQYVLQTAIMQQAYAQYLNQYMQMVSSQIPQRPPEPQIDPEPPQVAEPPNGPEVMPEEQDGEEAQADRDWLDWFYVLSRVLVLFCIVYFYSSPLRFGLVLLLGIGLYLYQTGFFRQPALNNNEAPRPENNNDQPTPEADPVNPANPPVNIDHRPTVLTIMWTFFTTFFASLIPEIPNAV